MQQIFRYKKCPARSWSTCIFRKDGSTWQRPMIILREGNWFTRLFRWAIKIDLELKWGAKSPGDIIYASLVEGPITDEEAGDFGNYLNKGYGLEDSEP